MRSKDFVETHICKPCVTLRVISYIHIVYYKYQQRSLQRRVLTLNSSNSQQLASLKYVYKTILCRHPSFFLAHPKHNLRTFPFHFTLPRPKSHPGATKQVLFPPPHYGPCLHFYHDKTLSLSSLVDSHRIAPTPAARRSQQLIPLILYFRQINSKSPTHVTFELQNQL